MKSYRVSHRWLIVLIIVSNILMLPVFLLASDPAQPIQGAASVINQVSSIMKTDTDTNRSGFTERTTLVQHMELFGQIKRSLSNEEAAQQWFSLMDQFLKLAPLDPRQIEVDNIDDFRSLMKTVSIKPLFEIIPGPGSWPALARIATERIDNGDAPVGYKSVLLFLNLLNLDIDLVLAGLDHFEKISIEQSPYDEEQIQAWFTRIKREVRKFDRSSKASSTIEAFSTLLTTFESFVTKPAIIRVPDLLAETDRENGASLLKRALANPNVYLVIPSGEETRKLGVSIALDDMEPIRRPQWGLVNSIDSDTVTFFERLYDKFERSKIDTDQDYTQMVQRQGATAPFKGEKELKQRAISYYVLGLLAQDRIEDALRFAGSLDNELLSAREFKNSLEATERPGLFRIYSRFLDSLVQQKPDLKFWKQYAGLALINHEEERIVSTIKRVLTNEPLEFLPQQELKKHLITLYLAQDRIEDALAMYREINSADATQQSSKVRRDFAEFRYDLGDDLYDLGKVMEQSDIAEEGVSMAVRAFQDMRSSPNNKQEFLSAYELGKIVTMLTDHQEYQRAEELIVQTIIEHIESSETSGQFSFDTLEYTLPDIFVELAKLYVKAGKYSEVIILLDQSPWWNAEDLVGLLDNDLLLAAAHAFNATGSMETAGRILKNYILQESNDDEAYSLLVDMDLHDTISWLDMFYKTDRFEERPLIWKAKLLYKEGSFDEAEKVIRQAMRVDPTDGEQKAGQRVYSYSLLADILEAKGDLEDATFFREVVDSVRIAERGDEFSKAGLITRSIDYYQDAMGVFADAYCIQWRLGERLYETGDLEGAKKHYKIAFERMPEQFGQVASFCFGCEGAFDKMESRSAAEEVFAHLLVTTPDRPQVYFLYGLLRNSQKRIPEAYEFFKQAVTLDEDYLDAWKEISKLSESVYLTRKEKDRIILKMLHLDPQQKHFSTNLSEVVDLTSLWQTLEQNQGASVTPSTSLYNLRASSKKLQEEREKNKNTSPEYFYTQIRSEDYRTKRLAPEEVLSQHPMAAMLDYFINLERM